LKIHVTGWEEREVEINLPSSSFKVEELRGRVRGRIVLLKREERIEAEGEIEFTLSLTCSRCLETFEVHKRERIRHFFLRKERLPKEKELSSEDAETTYYEEEVIDMLPVLRDTILLSIPLKPLCREECKGLCPVCGKNLNEGECEHVKKKEEEIDPRWEKLKALLEKEE